MAKKKTVTVKAFGRKWTVPAGLSTEEVIEFIKGVIEGSHIEPEPNPYVEPKQDIVVDGALDNKTLTELTDNAGLGG